MITLLMLLAACDDSTPEPTVAAEPAAPAHHEQPHDEPAAPEALAASGWSHYGAPFALTEAKPASEVLGDPASFTDATVLVEGKVTDVCQKAGCWMVITDDEHTMRVLMKDHNFSVDKGGSGAHCRVEGQIVAKEVDPAEVAHFASESADAENMPEHEAQNNVTYQLVATGVAMMPAEG